MLKAYFRMETDLIIFDLDGTLVDSSDDIAWAANQTLIAMGRNGMDMAAVKEGIGWGVGVLLERLMPGADAGKISEAKEKFLGFYWDHLSVSTVLYPGVRETLGYFERMNKKMAVVTNKPVRFTLKLMEDLAFGGFFPVVVGGDSLKNRKPHPEPVEKVIQAFGVSKERTALVGDSPIDCEAGKKAGIFTIGVEYGFRGKGELEAAGFDVLISKFPELRNILQ